jgi:hypothetical protein
MPTGTLLKLRPAAAAQLFGRQIDLEAGKP